MKPVLQRTCGDCLRACIASIFEIAYEDAPDTDPPRDQAVERAFSQRNVVGAWLRARGLVAWEIINAENHEPHIRRGHTVHPDGTRTPGDWIWPHPLGTYFVGHGPSPRNSEIDHAVVMDYHGAIAWDPHPDHDMTIDRISGITVFVYRHGSSESAAR